MSVRVIMNGRLGNNLFQYALGRIIAERHGFGLECSTEPLATYHLGRALPGGWPTTLESLSEYFPNAPLHLLGRECTTPVEAYHLNALTEWNGNAIPFETIMSTSAPRKISLYGYFQRFEYFADHLRSISRWFEHVTPEQPPSVGPRDVLLCVRRGFDYGVLGWALPTSYYHDALTHMRGIEHVWVCGTDIDPGLRQSLSRYNPTYFECKPIDQFILIQQFQRIVLSNSTFTWWAGLLSHAREIYAPRAGRGTGYAFTGFQNIDLHMRQPRYREIMIHDFAPMTFRLRSKVCGATHTLDRDRVAIARAGGESLELSVMCGESAVIEYLLTHPTMDEREYAELVSPRRRRRLLVQLADTGVAELDLRYDTPDDGSRG